MFGKNKDEKSTDNNVVVVNGVTFYRKAKKNMNKDEFVKAHISLIVFAPKIVKGAKKATPDAIKVAEAKLEAIYAQL